MIKRTCVLFLALWLTLFTPVAIAGEYPGRIVAVEQGHLFFENGDVYSIDFSSGLALRFVGNVYVKLGVPAPAAAPGIVPSGPSTSSSAARGILSTPSSASQQCAALTKRGAQCSRRAQAGSSYCWQHQR